jgi:hypothetical protein
VDLDAIWATQTLPEPLADFIEILSVHAHEHVTAPPGGQNVTEWCKKEKCWEQFRELDLELPAKVDTGLITRERAARRSEHTLDEQASAAEAEIIARVAGIQAETWFSLAAWAKDTQTLMPWQRSLSFSLGRLAGTGRPPSRKQATQGEKILNEARSLGFRG